MIAELLVRDLAIVLIIAAGVAYIFHRLQQPIVLGYIIAGVIIGPYTPPFNYISQQEVFSALAEVGVILLLFGIGLSFPAKKLLSLGRVYFTVASVDITLMLLLSIITGTILGWSLTDSLFLGVALASTSTAIIAKCLTDMGKLDESSSDIMLGVNVVEDLAVVVMLTVLQAFYSAGTLSLVDILILGGKIVLFLGGSLLVGWKLVLPFIERVQLQSKEILIIMTVGLCFAFSIAALFLGFSVATGAFIAGVILASLRRSEELITQTLPLRDVFGAIFFVSVGALMDVTKIGDYLLPVLAITLMILVSKVVGCSFGTMISGFGRVTSLRVGLGMAQVGEFAFIVVKAGSDLGVLTAPLFSIVGVVAIVTTFLTPYLISFSYRLDEEKLSQY